MHGSAMMYVTRSSLTNGSGGSCQFLDELAGALDEGGLCNNLVEAGGVRGSQAGRISVVRVSEDRNVRIRVGDFVGIDPRDVGDHEIGALSALDRDEVVLRQERLELAPEEEVDPTEQDRGHMRRLEPMLDAYKQGLEYIRAGRYFEAHEELELAWRAAGAEEKDFFQGLVHVAVAWYQAGRGRPVATARQLEKAARRLSGFAPAHRDVDVADVLAQVELARATVAAGSLELEPPRV